MGIVQMSAPPKITADDWKYYLSFDPFDYIQKTVDDLKTQNRFFVDERFQKIIYSYAKTTGVRTLAYAYLKPSDLALFRARIYRESDVRERFDNPEAYGMFQGFDAEGSFVPPAGKTVDPGRINPQNIRYLYTSSNEETCILEVRAKPGEYVSVASVELIEPAVMFDVSKNYASLWDTGDRKQEWYCMFYLALMELFQRAYQETGDYFLCQYISEYLKNWGYDGIMFRSAVNKGYLDGGINYTFFNYQKCKVVSSKLYYIAKMHVDTSPLIKEEEVTE